MTHSKKIKHANRFKSYYVVWKLYQHSNNIIIIIMFKSYYVVWKPYEVTTANDGRYHQV